MGKCLQKAGSVGSGQCKQAIGLEIRTCEFWGSSNGGKSELTEVGGGQAGREKLQPNLQGNPN